MKTFSIAALTAAACLIFAACSDKRPNLWGHVALDGDTMLVQYSYFTDEQIRSDTVVLADDGHFEIRLPDTAAMTVTVSTLAEWSDFAEVLFLPGDRMYMEGTLADLKVSGTELYDSLNRTGLLDMEKGIAAIEREFYGVAPSSGNFAKRDSLARLYNTSYLGFIDSLRNFIKMNPDNIACAYAFTLLSPVQRIEDYGSIGEGLKSSPAAPIIEYFHDAARKDFARKEAWGNLQPGAAAPDFRLKNLEGEYMTLGSFKGKYVLLDFWGSWCGWCIKGIPDMKEYYGKYKDCIEFVGIDCRDTQEEWREAVERHGLPWTNLYNGEDEQIVMAYGIQGYPTKIIIDPEGRVVQAFLGESPELYDKLDEIFGK